MFLGNNKKIYQYSGFQMNEFNIYASLLWFGQKKPRLTLRWSQFPSQQDENKEIKHHHMQSHLYNLFK